MSDQPQERSAALQRLDAFVGKWTVRLIFPHDPDLKAETVGSFEWLDDDRFFLVYRAGTKGSGYPVGHCIIGADDLLDSYTMLYSDSRGMARIYQMSLRDGVWKQWRDEPSSFSQRLTATFSEDGRTIRGAWEIKEEGQDWQLDFDIIYTRVSG